MKAILNIFPVFALFLPQFSFGAPQAAKLMPGDPMIAGYFASETKRLADACLTDVKSVEGWRSKRELYRKQLFEMLSLEPLPERTDLNAVITGKVEHPEFVVENLHFQSMPGLYVTANLYVPKKIEKRLPAILYVCGHGRVAKDGISFGNKVAYQHHGAWFARNGYVCLTIDTIQLGEIEGIHHGTYREGMWWWNSRGYTPAGVEAWNCIRALDYLETRREVDPAKFGVTGRSGGGAYSWWAVALDDRVQAAAPVAGITDLENHVVDGTVEGHCDCMFIVNTYRWDYAQVAALAAPRPLLICNSDKDSIFPLDGVQRVHERARKIYQLHQAGDKLGLLITEGPHKDTQDLQLPVFRWFNRHLKGEDPVIEMAATKFFEPEQLKVFHKIPQDERTSKIHETFVPSAASPAVPASAADWVKLREAWERGLLEKSFAGWPVDGAPLNLRLKEESEAAGVRMKVYEFDSQDGIRLPLFVFYPVEAAQADRVSFSVFDEESWTEFQNTAGQLLGRMAGVASGDAAYNPAPAVEWLGRIANEIRAEKSMHVVAAPRGIGPTAWTDNERKRVQIRRRFLLLGQTLDGMRVWDIRRAIQATRQIEGVSGKPVKVLAKKAMSVNALYASIFEPGIDTLELVSIPSSHRMGPDYLNVLRILDIPQAVAMAADRTRVRIMLLRPDSKADWEFPAAVARNLGWPQDRLWIHAARE